LGAATVYPAYLEDGPDGLLVHGLGADLELIGPPGRRLLHDVSSHIGWLWSDASDTLQPARRVQAEPHALVVRRQLLEDMGGLDEGLLSWFDHTDLALHHQRLRADAWLVPAVTCTYAPPPPVSW